MLRELDTQNSMGSEMVSSQTCPLQAEDAELIEELKNAYRCKWFLCNDRGLCVHMTSLQAENGYFKKICVCDNLQSFFCFLFQHQVHWISL